MRRIGERGDLPQRGVEAQAGGVRGVGRAASVRERLLRVGRTSTYEQQPPELDVDARARFVCPAAAQRTRHLTRETFRRGMTASHHEGLDAPRALQLLGDGRRYLREPRRRRSRVHTVAIVVCCAVGPKRHAVG